MTEEFIHYLWRFQLIRNPLATDKQEEIEVISTGQRNRDAGPDYLNARIRIGETLWAGDVEIHVRSSDWHQHGHDADRGFDGVILHIVHENDQVIERFDGQEIPTLEIKKSYDPVLFDRYEAFLTSLGWIPCEGSIASVNTSVLEPWFNFLAEERMNRRSIWVDRLFTRNKGHLDLTLYHCLACGFGQKVNTDPFEWLAQSVDIMLIMKYQPDLHSLEALLFGQAGFLADSIKGDYPLSLADRYEYLRKKHGLQPLPVHVWKFLRMRPSGFPTLRLAYWAAFLHQHATQLGRLLQIENTDELLKSFEQESSAYWWTHYHFDKKTDSQCRKLGKDAILTIILNSIVPFLFVKGIRSGDKQVLHRLEEFMNNLYPEENSVIRYWKSIGIPVKSALSSQALLELKTQYCDRKNCLVCAIGNDLIRGSSGNNS